jgi:thiol-disulfide isomerase/thioredoxin
MRFFGKHFFIGLVAGAILMVLIIIGGGYILIRSFTSRNGEKIESILQPPPVPVQTRMDYNWRLRGLDGNELDIRKTKGRIIFLNFWATWCPPCVAEMPSIQRLYDQIKNEEINFMVVSEEDRAKVDKFVKERGFTFPVYTVIGEKPRVFQTRGIPTTFIISRDGQIVFRHVGAAKWDHESSIDFLKGLM